MTPAGRVVVGAARWHERDDRLPEYIACMTPSPDRIRRSGLGGGAAALAIATLLGGLGVLSASASASSSLPLSPTTFGATAAHGLQVEPASIIYTGDGTGLLGGASVGAKSSRIEWTQWTANVAVGSGFDQLNNCKPYCAAGTFTGYAVKIEMWRPRMLGGSLVFTRMTIVFLKHTPPNTPTHYTFTDTLTSGPDAYYGWGPPSAALYCTYHGKKPYPDWKPEPGCQNIHELPPEGLA